jgi:hypothetical protein
VMQRSALTAKTRNNDVLPAFCRPSMVMSISVDLKVEVSDLLHQLSRFLSV